MSRGKRAMDLCALIVLAPLLLPLGLLIGFAVLLDSPGPVFYRARRIGRGGRPFEMLKFRTMRVGLAGRSLAGAGDPRITPLGRALRSSRLDELPQLWNVLRGEMSFVGPRPELAEFVDAHAEDYRQILAVPPGITGPTQLRYAGVEARLLGGHEDPETFYLDHLLPDKVALDLDYARTRSALGDLAVIALTFGLPLALLRQRLSSEGSVTTAAGPAFAYLGVLAVTCLTVLAFFLGVGSPR
jgi:lipopolysaccharide/colanic/teichoic acid biosynthesis glycosyltransferase